MKTSIKVTLFAIVAAALGFGGFTRAFAAQPHATTPVVSRPAEASDGDGEVPDAVEAAHPTHAGATGTHHTEASDGDGEVPDAAEAPHAPHARPSHARPSQARPSQSLPSRPH